MTSAVEQAAAIVALLRAGLRGHTWPSIATEVWLAGDATTVWRDLMEGDALVSHPSVDDLLANARSDVQRWSDQGLRMLTVLDAAYPSRLRDIREVPPFVFVAGDLHADDRGMSVVGSRRASERGHQVARTAAELLVSKGLSVIAGLAAGIDTTAHRTALELDGRTVAFLGTGINQSYPAQNRDLQRQISERGLLVSQFWPDAAPSKSSFPIRNAAMSGYGMGTIVIEAGETSGTRIQARVAVEHGRPVILTDLVVERTDWGRALVGRPGVHVVSSSRDLAEAIDRIAEEEGQLSRALEELGRFDPAVA